MTTSGIVWDQQLFEEAVEWVFERVGVQDLTGKPIKVKMFGGKLDGQFLDGRAGMVPPVVAFEYEEEHAMLVGVTMRYRDEWIPSLFAPNSYCFLRTVTL